MDTVDNFRLSLRRPEAVAHLRGSDKYRGILGDVMFYTVQNGVIVYTYVRGLPTSGTSCHEPVFAFHIHSGTACRGTADDPFADAGAHFDPEDCEHPYHAGDMPPLFGVNGRAFSMFLTDRFTVDEVLGRAVIIHAHPDDFMTQPSGNSGEKIACGIITPTAR